MSCWACFVGNTIFTDWLVRTKSRVALLNDHMVNVFLFFCVVVAYSLCTKKIWFSHKHVKHFDWKTLSMIKNNTFTYSCEVCVCVRARKIHFFHIARRKDKFKMVNTFFKVVKMPRKLCEWVSTVGNSLLNICESAVYKY